MAKGLLEILAENPVFTKWIISLLAVLLTGGNIWQHLEVKGKTQQVKEKSQQLNTANNTLLVINESLYKKFNTIDNEKLKELDRRIKRLEGFH